MKLALDGPLTEAEVEANRVERIATERLNGTHEPWTELKFNELRRVRDAGQSEKRVRNPYGAPASADQLRGVGRNQPCPCGSGRKAKYCCLNT